METFNFYLDTKSTIWYRSNFEIEANSEEEAKEKAIQMIKENGEPTNSYNWEQLDDTLEHLSVEDNQGDATEELFFANKNDIKIWSNDEKIL